MARGPVEVDAFDQDNRRALSHRQASADRQRLDQTTATIRLKAMFPNEDEKLWPGEFVNARVSARDPQDVLVIPPAAVQRGPQGLFIVAVIENDIGRAAADRGRPNRPTI